MSEEVEKKAQKLEELKYEQYLKKVNWLFHNI
jgi:hypothetical protein